MKKNIKNLAILITIIVYQVISTSAFAQVPPKMSYQAVIRDTNNNLVTNTALGMRISILQGSSNGTPVYVETQTPTTNINGLATIEIGTGTVITGSFASINWAASPYFIKTETDPTGGTSYSITGNKELISVPYALYAANAGSSDGFRATINNFSTSGVDVPFNNVIFNDGGNYNPTTGKYICPTNGVYNFNGRIYIQGNFSNPIIDIYVNGVIAQNIINSGQSPYQTGYSATLKLNAGDNVSIRFSCNCTISNCVFAGYKVY